MMYDEWMRKSIIKLSKYDLQISSVFTENRKPVTGFIIYIENRSFP